MQDRPSCRPCKCTHEHEWPSLMAFKAILELVLKSAKAHATHGSKRGCYCKKLWLAGCPKAQKNLLILPMICGVQRFHFSCSTSGSHAHDCIHDRFDMPMQSAWGASIGHWSYCSQISVLSGCRAHAAHSIASRSRVTNRNTFSFHRVPT